MGTAAPPLGIRMSHTSPHGVTASTAFHFVKTIRIDNTKTTNNVKADIAIYNTQSDYAAGKPPIDETQFVFTLVKNDGRSGAGDILEQCYTAMNASSNAGGVDYAGGSSTDIADTR